MFKQPVRYTFFLSIAAAGLFSAPLSAAKAGRIASMKVHNLRLQSDTESALVSLARQYKIVIAAYGDLNLREGSLDPLPIQSASFSTGTLEQVFDAIVKQDPGYRWEETDHGSIHFIYSRRPSLLDVKVSRFTARNLDRYGALTTLPKIPEVNDWLTQHTCRFGQRLNIVGSGRPLPWARSPSIALRNASFADILDEIAAKSHSYYWQLFEEKPLGACVMVIDLS